MDVAHPASRRRPRNQRIARPGKRADQDHHDLRRRDPRFLHSRVPREEGRRSRPLHLALVPGYQNRYLPYFLRAILRRRPRRNDRLGLRNVSQRLRRVAFRRRTQRIHGADRRAPLHPTRLRHLPRGGQYRPRAFPGRPLRPPGKTAQWRLETRRSNSDSPSDRKSQFHHPAQFSADHALLPGPDQRGAGAATDRLCEVARSGRKEDEREMSTTVIPEMPGQEIPAESRVNYLNASYGVKSWLLTTDHKRIALLYLGSITLMFFVGGFFAVLMRLHLIEPQGALVAPETYNKLFTMHGVIMVFFFLVPSIPATLGNFLVPMMIGARDLAFPRLNLLSWYIYIIGASFTLYAVISGGVDTGWTFYTPYSSSFSHTSVIPTALGVFVTGFSSILTGLNFVVTIHKMRAPGLTWFRLPLFIWAMYATSIIFILGTPVIAITLFLLGLERLMHIGIFDPAIGGDPILLQHMFWFYSHPAVYIMILPGMGVMSELITCFSRKRIFGYTFVAFSSLAIAIISFLVWGHHMFVTGQSIYAGLIFSVLSFLVAIPSAVKVFNWTATLYKGSISYDAPMLYALGFIGLFTMGGLTGLFLASLATDVHLNGTYFIVAHFHYIMVGGAVMAYLGGIHFWWPKITGRLYPDGWARFAALVIFVGFNLTFFPQFMLGYLGMPRRYAVYPAEFQVFNVMSSAGASILGIGYLIPLIYLTWSMRYGPAAGPNPWGAKGLEWTTPSPPPTENFEEIPVVTEDAYDYANSTVTRG